MWTEKNNWQRGEAWHSGIEMQNKTVFDSLQDIPKWLLFPVDNLTKEIEREFYKNYGTVLSTRS